jgi:hypothetical protein
MRENSKEKCDALSDIDRGQSRVIMVRCSRAKGHKGDHTYHETSFNGLGNVAIWKWKNSNSEGTS